MNGSQHVPSLRWPWGAALVGLASVTLTPSCTLTIERDRVQCSVATDCLARGSRFAQSTCENNFCVVPEPSNQPSPPAKPDAGSVNDEPADCKRDSECDGISICSEGACVDPFDCALPAQAGAATITMPVTDVFGMPLPLTPARLCRNIDPTCASPVADFKADENGLLTVHVPENISGYLEFQVESYFPQLQSLPANLQDKATLSGISLSPIPVIHGLAMAVGAAPNPERGHILITVLNCHGPAAGVQLSSNRADDGSIPFYVLDGVPSTEFTETTVDGSAGFLNYPAGNAGVTLMHGETQTEIAKLSFVVRPGFITVARLKPELE